MKLLSLYIFLASFATTFGAKFNLRLLANTYSDSTFSNYGLAPVYQNDSYFDGLVFLLGENPVTFVYDNETQIVSYTQNNKEYYLYVQDDYLVGQTDIDIDKIGSYNKFLMNMDGTLWVTKINNNVGYNLFYTYPTKTEIYNHKTYLSVFLLADQTQSLDTQMFTIVYKISGNSTNPILPYSSEETATNITTITLINSTETSSPNATAGGAHISSSTSGIRYTSTVIKTETQNYADRSSCSYTSLMSTLLLSLLAIL
ncbi:hypothetical protein CLIB1423_04S07470 [[Candida] railenensis]|uniref:Uncharacterized protein n=1 Tax=[Candida] railenensis TaxID=45579 RepID=A0A9P0QNJ9_9ASCO|nr:hypothetical protein CLIB1423_04S07470 [[Candida] railenensis]